MAHPHSQPDVFVRPAADDDAAAIGRIQLAAWQAAGLLPEHVLDQADAGQFAQVWRATITGAQRQQAVLVACERATAVGFAAITPAADPDSGEATYEIATFEIAPDRQRLGHGSRLLSAGIDTITALGGRQVQIWVVAGDEAREHFLASAGFAADGAERELEADSGARTVLQRWSCELG